MPVPISTLNPWDIDNQTNKPKRIFFPELVYCYEKNKSIFQFKLYNKNKLSNIKNSSFILNKMFGKSF